MRFWGGEAVPKTEVLEQPPIKNLFLKGNMYNVNIHPSTSFGAFHLLLLTYLISSND
jgi:hypothetical protein